MGILLFLLFLTTLVSVAEPIKDEWIVTRLDATSRWDFLPKGSKIISKFGPQKEHAHVYFEGSRAQFSRSHFRLQPNFRYRSLDSWDPDFEKSWALKNTGLTIDGVGKTKSGADLGMTAAWKLFQGSETVRVAVLDTGIDASHPELKDQILKNPGEIPGNGNDDDGNGFIDDVSGWNFVADSSDANDDRYHGTFISGIIGARAKNGEGTRGINWRVTLIPVKMLNEHGLGSTATAAKAIDYAVAMGAHVINASWGGGEHDAVLYEAIEKAKKAGVLVVAAAGNDGQSNEGDGAIYPASYSLNNIISVAAYDARDQIWPNSNYGKSRVHIGAPGVAIYGIKPNAQSTFLSGTSYAAAHVTGVAALLKGYRTKLTLSELRTRILETSEVIGHYEKERTVTAGRVHAGNALANVRPPRPQVPSVWKTREQTVKSPHPYPNNFKETYVINAPGASHVRVFFKTLKTESFCDFVILRDRRGVEIMRYSGDVGSFWSAEALGDQISITLETDGVRTDEGFVIDTVQFAFLENKKSQRGDPHWLSSISESILRFIGGGFRARAGEQYLRQSLRSYFQRPVPHSHSQRGRSS